MSKPKDTRAHKSLVDWDDAPWLGDVSDPQATALWILDYIGEVHDCDRARAAAKNLRPNTAARGGERARLMAEVAAVEHQQEMSVERMAAAPRHVNGRQQEHEEEPQGGNGFAPRRRR